MEGEEGGTTDWSLVEGKEGGTMDWWKEKREGQQTGGRRRGRDNGLVEGEEGGTTDRTVIGVKR